MKLGILTDSGSNLTLDYINSEENLKLVPLQINIDGVYYRDVIEIDPERVYNTLKHKHVTTSLPKNEDFFRAVEDFKKAGYTDLLYISISSGLSGTYNSIRNAASHFDDINIHLYDSKTLSMAQGYLVKEAVKLASDNVPLEDIITKIDKLRDEDSLAMFTVETLKWLRKGGRIGFVEGTVGDILHVKPIIAVNEDGVYHTLSKGFGMKRTFITMRKKIKETFNDDEIDITIHYGGNLKEAQNMETKLTQDLNVKKIVLTPLTPVLGVHTGPGVLAICVRRV